MWYLDIGYDYNGRMILAHPRDIPKALFLDIFPRRSLKYTDFCDMLRDIAVALKGIYFQANVYDPVVFLFGPIVDGRKNMLLLWLQNWTKWDPPTDTYELPAYPKDGIGIFIAQYRYEVSYYEDYDLSFNIPVDIPVETLTKLAGVMDKYSVFLDTSMF